MMTTPGETRALGELARFLVVGCINVAMSLTVFSACHAVLSALPQAATIAATLSNAIGYLAGMASSFTLNKSWTFRDRGSTARQLPRFLALNLAGMGLGSLSLLVLVDLGGGPPLGVWLGTTAAVVLLNFLGNKYWTFEAQPAAVESEQP